MTTLEAGTHSCATRTKPRRVADGAFDPLGSSMDKRYDQWAYYRPDDLTAPAYRLTSKGSEVLSCTCPDFNVRQRPCKHMIALTEHLGAVPEGEKQTEPKPAEITGLWTASEIKAMPTDDLLRAYDSRLDSWCALVQRAEDGKGIPVYNDQTATHAADIYRMADELRARGEKV